MRFRKEKGKYLRRLGWLFNMLAGECWDLHDISCRWSVFQVHAAYNFSSATTIFAGDRWEFWYAFSLCLLQTILSFSRTTRVLVLMRITFSSVTMMFARMCVYLVVNASSMLLFVHIRRQFYWYYVRVFHVRRYFEAVWARFSHMKRILLWLRVSSEMIFRCSGRVLIEGFKMWVKFVDVLRKLRISSCSS